MNAGQTRAGKAIDPMAVSATPTRFSDFAKTEKWFTRNCKTVLGRECTRPGKRRFHSLHVRPLEEKCHALQSAALFIAITCIPASAAGIGPVKDAVTKSECGACHMVYPAGLLPARSWDAITSDLSRHFGEDATLAPDVVAGIKAYLMTNAGDAGGTVMA